VIDLVLPNFIEILSMEHGDYGASRHQKITEDPINSEMYRLCSEEKIDTLGKNGLSGIL